MNIRQGCNYDFSVFYNWDDLLIYDLKAISKYRNFEFISEIRNAFDFLVIYTHKCVTDWNIHFKDHYT